MQRMTRNTNPELETLALIEQEPEQKRDLLAWWQRLAAPPEPDTSSAKERDAYRRGIYISYTLFALTIVNIVLLTVVGGLLVHILILPFTTELLLVGVGVILNKKGQVIWSGIIILLALESTVIAAILAQQQHFSAFYLPLFDLFVIPEIFAVTLLPASFVFFDTGFHILLMVGLLLWLHKDAQLAALFANKANIAITLLRPAIGQGVVAVVSFTWMSSVNASFKRANRATSVALIERELAKHSQLEAEQKKQLEREIQTIVQVHSQIANGNYEARVPLEQGSILSSLAGSLNNLTARLQNLLKDAQQHRRLYNALERFYHARLTSRNGPIPSWTPTGTPVDVLVQQHNAYSGLQDGRNPSSKNLI